MTEKQHKFADEYIIDCNATRAYKAAYPRVKKDGTAAAAAVRLLRNVKVEKYVSEKLAELSDERCADAKEVMEYLTSVMRGESESEIIIVEGTGEGYSEARRVTKNPDEKEKLKAAELLGKRFGLFSDKLQLEGSAKVVIVDDLDN